MVVVDNSATAMTGFQPHAGTGETATGSPAPVVDIERLCSSLGVRVETCDPFNLRTPRKSPGLDRQEGGVRVLISRRNAPWSRPRGKRPPTGSMWTRKSAWGVLRLCPALHRTFKCPGLIWNQEKANPRLTK